MTAHCVLLEPLQVRFVTLDVSRDVRTHALQVATLNIALSRTVPPPHRLAYPLWETRTRS